MVDTYSKKSDSIGSDTEKVTQISHLFYISTDTRQLSTKYTKRISADRTHATESCTFNLRT